MKKIASILFLILTISIYGQSKMNQYNSSGKKHGKWAVYLDNEWKEIKDSSKASFIKYTYFDNGTNLYPMGPRDKSWMLKNSNGVSSTTGLVILNGEYSWIDKKGQLRAVDVFKNGEYVMHKFYYSNGKINQIFDYTKKYKGQDYTYTISEYNKDGKMKFYIHRNGTSGWMLYEGSEDDLK